MRLLAVELDRYRARSVVQWLFVALILLSASGAMVALGPSTPIPESERARQVEQYEQYRAMWEENHEEMYEQCLADQALDRETYPDADWGCEWNLEEPLLSHFLWEQTFATSGLELVDGVTLGILLIVLLASVSFVAAEFSTGAIGTWLTFEPRRVRVYLSKLGAALVGAAVLAGVGYVVTVASVYVPFAVRGTSGEVTAQTWADVGGGLGRFTLIAVLLAILGVGLAFLLRHLAATLGAVAGWFVLEQLAALAYPHVQRWTVMVNLSALRENGSSYYLDVCRFDERHGGRFCEWTEFPVSALQGGLVLGGIAALVTVVSILVFSRRDVA